MQEERLVRNAIRPNSIRKSRRSQGARRSRCLDRETALVMEDAVGCPARKQCSLPSALRKARSRHFIIEVEVEHLWFVDGQIRFLALGRQGRILYRCVRGVSPSAGDCSQVLRPGVTEAARQSVAEPLGDLDLKRVVPGIAIVSVCLIYAVGLRKWR